MKFKVLIMEIISVGVTVAMITGGAFLLGIIGNKMQATIGKEYINIQRENFKESNAYVESMVKYLAEAKKDYDKTNDIKEKEQIKNAINIEFANFDINKIENATLKNFLLTIRGELE